MGVFLALQYQMGVVSGYALLASGTLLGALLALPRFTSTQWAYLFVGLVGALSVFHSVLVIVNLEDFDQWRSGMYVTATDPWVFTGICAGLLICGYAAWREVPWSRLFQRLKHWNAEPSDVADEPAQTAPLH